MLLLMAVLIIFVIVIVINHIEVVEAARQTAQRHDVVVRGKIRCAQDV